MPAPTETKHRDTLPLTKLLGMFHPLNPKQHDLMKIIGSILRNGFVGTITICLTTGVIVRGHGRIKSLDQMKRDGVSAPSGVTAKKGEWHIPIEYKFFASVQDRDAFVIADNATTEAGGWDNDARREILESLEDRSGTGYDDDEISALLEERSLDDVGSEGRTIDVAGSEPHTRVIGATPAPKHKVLPPAEMTNADWSVHLGDCLGWLRTLADNSVDGVVMDPPGGISFMSEEWDGDKGGRDKWIAWLASIVVECKRVLKPGGFMFTWSFVRTSHWTAFSIEDGGFNIRDRVAWLYLNGFPKYLDISKAIDQKLGAQREVIGEHTIPGAQMQEMSNIGGEKQAWTGIKLGEAVTAAAAAYKGYATALKPAVEDWWLVRKDLDGTNAENALKWGTGGLNIDACRIGDELTTTSRHGHSGDHGVFGADDREGEIEHSAPGRYPPHLIVGEGITIDGIEDPPLYFYCPKPAASEKEAGLDELEPTTGAEATKRKEGSAGVSNPRAGAGRGGGRRNTHKTVKPINLMRWLVRLIAPPPRYYCDECTLSQVTDEMCPSCGKAMDLRKPLIIDPFTGSGTTGLAALIEGCRFAGAELMESHHQIATMRLRSLIDDPRRIETADDDHTNPDG